LNVIENDALNGDALDIIQNDALNAIVNNALNVIANDTLSVVVSGALNVFVNVVFNVIGSDASNVKESDVLNVPPVHFEDPQNKNWRQKKLMTRNQNREQCQGSLSEGKGSVQLTSLFRSAHFYIENIIYLFY
jgi:hypothetical protein